MSYVGSGRSVTGVVMFADFLRLAAGWRDYYSQSVGSQARVTGSFAREYFGGYASNNVVVGSYRSDSCSDVSSSER